MGVTLEQLHKQRAMLERGEKLREIADAASEHKRLRDKFAMAALTGVLLFQRDDEKARASGDIARWAYALADAMLRERQGEVK